MKDKPEPRIRVVPMTAETVEAVEAIERACFPDPWSLESLAEELSNPLAVFFVAEVCGEVAGYVGMHHIIDEGYITNIAVLERFRRQGVAQALTDKLIAYGEKNGLRMTTLEVRPSNGPARQMYRKLGFEEAGRRKNFYINPIEDALLMTREL